jgi:acetyltransferase-like isoleucine patch superfamily enzyme
VEVIEPVNLYNCSLGDRVFVGPFVEIQKNVEIGSDTRIQSHSFICELVKIGSNCFIGHGVVFINDTFSGKKDQGSNHSSWRPTKIGSHVYIGSNATILPVSICDHVIIGAGAVVTKDILEPGTYAGNPAGRLL